MAFADPFGLDTVFADAKARAIYIDGKRLLASCAAGASCSKQDARAAAAGLAVINAAEADPNITMTFRTGKLAGTVPATCSYGLNASDCTLAPSNKSIGVNFEIEAVVMHEAHESYERLIGSGGSPSPAVFGPLYPQVRTRAVRQAEDPVYRAMGRRTRTERSPTRDLFGPPLPF